MAAAKNDDKRKAIAALGRLGKAGPRAIAREMGPEWLAPKKFACLVQMLRRMRQAHFIMQVEYGVYCVSPSCSWRGFDARDETEKSIRNHLRQNGGVARTRDILDALTDRRISGPEDHDYGHRLIRQALKAGFRKDFGHGRWNLPSDEMEHVPLVGWVADHQIQVNWPTSGAQGPFASWEAQRADFFRRVGYAFRDARGERNAADVTLNADVGTVLDDMARNAPSARRDALNALREHVARELLADGITERWAIESETRRLEDTDMVFHLYEAFERGNVELHLAAPADLYQACGIMLDVCPVRLSRAEVEPRVSGFASSAIACGPMASVLELGGY